MNFETGDVVRFKNGKDGVNDYGLHEITGTYEGRSYQYSITYDECNSETYSKHEDLILVCSVKDRKDIS